MYSRPEGRTTVRERWTVVQTTIFLSGQQFFVVGQHFVVVGQHRFSVFSVKTDKKFCRTRKFSVWTTENVGGQKKILSGQTKNGRGPMSATQDTVLDKIATVLDKTSRVHGQDWFVRQTEKTVVRTKKSVVRTKTSVVRTKKSVVRTKKTVKRTMSYPQDGCTCGTEEV